LKGDLYLNIGITGHRDLVPAEIPVLESAVKSFFLGLQQRYPDLPLKLLSPLAAGGDQLAARVAVEAGIPLVAVLPMKQSEYERDFTPDELAGFRALMAAADQVVELSPGANHESIPPDAPITQERDRRYAEAGLFVSNHCQVLLALWDGKANGSPAGTAEMVRYHLTAVLEGMAERQSSAHLLSDNENDLAYHIVCSRDRPDGDPAPGLIAGEAGWLSARSGHIPVGELPPDYALMFDHFQTFVRDSADLGTTPDHPTLLEHAPRDLVIPPAAQLAVRLFDSADRLAVQFQRRVSRGLSVLYTIAVLMGLVAITFSEYSLPHQVLWVFLALFFSGFGLHLYSGRRQWHRKYLDYRALAEALRVQFYLSLAGAGGSGTVAFAHENFLQKQDVELGWIRHVMRTVSARATANVVGNAEPDARWLPWVIENWVGGQVSGDRASGKNGAARGQLAYYTGKELKNSLNYRRTQQLGAICLWAGIAMAFVLAIAGGRVSPDQRPVLMIMMGILPLIAGIRDAISHKKAEKELIKQYRFMARIFGNARRMLDDAGTDAFRRRVLTALGEAALEEGAEWILMHRARPLEHQGLG